MQAGQAPESPQANVAFWAWTSNKLTHSQAPEWPVEGERNVPNLLHSQGYAYEFGIAARPIGDTAPWASTPSPGVTVYGRYSAAIDDMHPRFAVVMQLETHSEVMCAPSLPGLVELLAFLSPITGR